MVKKLEKMMLWLLLLSKKNIFLKGAFVTEPFFVLK
jgi:hypothetical protein